MPVALESRSVAPLPILSESQGNTASPTALARPLRLFISYSHKDDHFRQGLETHLTPLMRAGVLQIWSDRHIDAGQEWKQSIYDKLETSDIILLLVSPDFLASEFCQDTELRHAMARHKAGKARVIPVFLRPCGWKDEVFGELQGIPDDAKPITTWNNRDKALDIITKAIRRIAEVIANEKAKQKIEECARKEAEAQAKQEAEERARGEAAARNAAEERARQAEEHLQQEAEARRKAEERARQEMTARQAAEDSARQETSARQVAEQRARQAEEHLQQEAEARRKAEGYVRQEAKAKQATEERIQQAVKARQTAEERAQQETAARQAAEERARQAIEAWQAAEEQTRQTIETLQAAEERIRQEAEIKHNVEKRLDEAILAKQSAEERAHQVEERVQQEAKAKHKAEERSSQVIREKHEAEKLLDKEIKLRNAAQKDAQKEIEARRRTEDLVHQLTGGKGKFSLWIVRHQVAIIPLFLLSLFGMATSVLTRSQHEIQLASAEQLVQQETAARQAAEERARQAIEAWQAAEEQTRQTIKALQAAEERARQAEKRFQADSPPPSPPLPPLPPMEQSRIQRGLQLLGLYSGRSNGNFENDMRKAIRDFQASLGKPQTGELLPEQWLELAVRAAGEAAKQAEDAAARARSVANRGQGIMVHKDSDGSFYRGGGNGGLKQRQGVQFWNNAQLTYEGEWVDDQMSGFGVLSGPELRLEGEFSRDEANGFAIMTYKDTCYKGEFVDHQASGYGVQWLTPSSGPRSGSTAAPEQNSKCKDFPIDTPGEGERRGYWRNGQLEIPF